MGILVPDALPPNSHAPDYHLFSAEAVWEFPIRTPDDAAELFLWLAGPVLGPDNNTAIAAVGAELVSQFKRKGLADDVYVVELPDARMVLRWTLVLTPDVTETRLHVEAWPSRHHEPWDSVLRGVHVNIPTDDTTTTTTDHEEEV